jgi:hypothetical protein
MNHPVSSHSKPLPHDVTVALAMARMKNNHESIREIPEAVSNYQPFSILSPDQTKNGGRVRVWSSEDNGKVDDSNSDSPSTNSLSFHSPCNKSPNKYSLQEVDSEFHHLNKNSNWRYVDVFQNPSALPP